MGLAAQTTPQNFDNTDEVVERRAAPRVTSLIRAAKLICGKGEFVCVLRDVSESGVGVRCFHSIPDDPDMALELQNGETFAVEQVRSEAFDASYRFADRNVEIERLVHENWLYPRRQLRMMLAIPMTLRTLHGPIPAVTINVSQQGCRIEAQAPLAIAQSVVIESPHLPPIRAKVRWRRDGECGLAFDDTFSLRDFAVTTARLQCPSLVETAGTGREI